MSTDIYEAPKADVSEKNLDYVSLTWVQILFSFKGRIPRKTFWLSYIGIMLCFCVLMLTPIFIESLASFLLAIMLAMYIPVIWIPLALSVNRWHDRDKSGWWVLIGFVPLIGPIWTFVEVGCLAGTDGPNDYGPPTK